MTTENKNSYIDVYGPKMDYLGTVRSIGEIAGYQPSEMTIVIVHGIPAIFCHTKQDDINNEQISKTIPAGIFED